VTVTIQHDKLAALIGTPFSVLVLDSQLTSLSVHPFSATEGAPTGPVVGIATFTDVGGPELLEYAASIDWGDGYSDIGSIVSIGGTALRVDGPSHTYAEEGSYVVIVSVEHNALPPVNGTTLIVVVDPPVALTPVPFVSIVNLVTSQVLATFIDPGSNETSSDYTATIDWGDDSPLSTGVVTGPVDGVYSVSGSHLFDNRKRVTCNGKHSFVIKITVTQDADAGAVATSGFTKAVCQTQVFFDSAAGSFCAGHTFLTTGSCLPGGDEDSSSDYQKLSTAVTIEFSRTVIEGNAFCGTGFQFLLDSKIRIDTAKIRRADGYFRDDDHGTASFSSHLKFHDRNLILSPGSHTFSIISTNDGCFDDNVAEGVGDYTVTFEVSNK